MRKRAERRAPKPSSPRPGRRPLLPRPARRRHHQLRPCLRTSLLQDGAPAPTTAGRTRCTGRLALLLHHRQHQRLALLHRRQRRLHQHLLRLPPGARLTIHGPAWSRPGPCPGWPPLRSVHHRPTPAPGRPACIPTLAPLDSLAHVRRRTPTTPLRSTTPTPPTEGGPTCNISPLPCSWRLHRLHRLHHRPRLLHHHLAGTSLRFCRP